MKKTSQRNEDRAEQKLRFVVGPEGGVFYDPSGKAPAEGVFVPLSQVKEEIESGKLFETLNVKGEEGVLNQVLQQATKRFAKALSLAKKTGALVVGTANVLEKAKAGKLHHILLAKDAGKDVKRKIEALNALVSCEMHTNVYDEALGGVNIVVVGITNSKKAAPLLKELEILTTVK